MHNILWRAMELIQFELVLRAYHVTSRTAHILWTSPKHTLISHNLFPENSFCNCFERLRNCSKSGIRTGRNCQWLDTGLTSRTTPHRCSSKERFLFFHDNKAAILCSHTKRQLLRKLFSLVACLSNFWKLYNSDSTKKYIKIRLGQVRKLLQRDCWSAYNVIMAMLDGKENVL